MKKILLLLALVLAAVVCANGQQSKIRYQGDVNLGYSFTPDDNVNLDYMFQLHFVNGIRFNKYVSAGIGVGIEYHPDWYGATFVPIFLDVKAYFAHSKVACMFACLDIGTSIETSYGESSLLLNPTVGAKFFVGQKTSAITLAVGYDLRSYRAILSTLYTHSMNIKVGFSF